ncbi:symmetrical bis(5'-nucleosyl)-tetraphosphatase [Comamonas sp. GB3 AK4-5]|uniref:symmetrical bis(5'-nucleosyl)-tetraphosphatase n=1 Tax=Comamonas sp. GB3 AK4-5 TaxID=3231487 RepID=UPI00351DB80E
MAYYLIGDIQGCHGAFQRLLQQMDFSPSRDTLFLLGDLVNRGPDSAGVLRQCMAWGDAVQAVLGNHDLHLLAAAHGMRKSSRRDTLASVLDAPDCEALIDWLRQQPLARSWHDAHGQRLLMLHAGVQPSWTLDDTLALSEEVQQVLRGPDLADFLRVMYGNLPDCWHPTLDGDERLRVIVNTLTRIRFCSAEGRMDFDSAESAEHAPAGLMPWFDCPDRRTAQDVVAFGHWSTLGLINRPQLMALDTGCVWGGQLTAVRLDSDLQQRQLFQLDCEQAQQPG